MACRMCSKETPSWCRHTLVSGMTVVHGKCGSWGCNLAAAMPGATWWAQHGPQDWRSLASLLSQAPQERSCLYSWQPEGPDLLVRQHVWHPMLPAVHPSPSCGARDGREARTRHSWGPCWPHHVAPGIAAGRSPPQPPHLPIATLTRSHAGKRKHSPARKTACGPSGCGSQPEVVIGKGAAPSAEAAQGGAHRGTAWKPHADEPLDSANGLAMLVDGISHCNSDQALRACVETRESVLRAFVSCSFALADSWH